MNEELIELFARLSLHEYLLENIIARGLMADANPLASCDITTRDVIARFRFSGYAGNDVPELLQIQERAVVLAEAFGAKLRARVSGAG